MRYYLFIIIGIVAFMPTAHASSLMRDILKYECQTMNRDGPIGCKIVPGETGPTMYISHKEKPNARELYEQRKLVLSYLQAGGSYVDIKNEATGAVLSCSKIHNRLDIHCNKKGGD